jgi:membrane-associated phospholipid phosphatase
MSWTGGEAADSKLRWTIIFLVFAADAVWLTSTDLSLAAGNGAIYAAAGLLLLAAVYFYFCLRKVGGSRRLIARFALQLTLFFIGAGILSYLAVPLNMRLVDPDLAYADSLIGFDWREVFSFVQDRPLIGFVLKLAYASSGPQILFTISFLILSARHAACRDFTVHIFISALACIFISALFPGESAWVHYGAEDSVHAYHLAHFTGLRDGTMTSIEVMSIGGVVTFPSFHTALALVSVYAVRQNRGVFAAILCLNIAVIASTFTEGGHYLADVIGGALIAAASIHVRKRNLLSMAPFAAECRMVLTRPPGSGPR